jgi:hypothetical protein
LYLDPAEDISNTAYKKLLDIGAYYTSFYTYEDLIIEVYVENSYVGKMDSGFSNRNYTPGCGEYGTMTVGFASDTKKKFSGSASGSKKVIPGILVLSRAVLLMNARKRAWFYRNRHSLLSPAAVLYIVLQFPVELFLADEFLQ